MAKISILLGMILGMAATSGPAVPQDRKKLLEEIARLEAAYGGHIGFMAKNLGTGEAVSANAAERFPTASAIKLPILAAFFQLAEEKKIDPDEWITLTQADSKPGSGILQLLSEGSRITLLDAAKLMIVESDNTATNLVLDRLAPTHMERLGLINGFLARKGLKNTRILNRLYSWDTKQRTPEALRYGIGVSTPEDMVLLLESLYARTLVSPASCAAMLDILKSQSYRDMIPRYLPEEECQFLEIANKTGSVNETKVDLGLILSDKADIAMALFVDKHPDHRGDIENRGVLLGAMVARAVWNHFTGSAGYQERKASMNQVDWNTYPGGRWGIYRSAAAPFPHPRRKHGYKVAGSAAYPYHPHYDDNSIVVVVPETFLETEDGISLIVHFHGEMGDNMAALERDRMPQILVEQRVNAILALPQGPYRAPDSFGGKMEDPGGLRHLVEDILATMAQEKVIKSTKLKRLILSAEGSGGPSAALGLQRGEMKTQVTGMILFDAWYGRHNTIRDWLALGRGSLVAVHTGSLAAEYARFKQALGAEAQKRLLVIPASVGREELVPAYFGDCLKAIGFTAAPVIDGNAAARQR